MIATMLPVTALTQAASGTGVMSGTVLDEAGRPVPTARLGYSKLAEYSQDDDGQFFVRDPGFSRLITVGTDGRFVLSGLPAGRYSVCALAIQADQLGSCDWGGGAALELAPGQRIDNYIRRIWEGTVLSLRVSDPNRRIALPDSASNLTRERRFFIGASVDSGLYRRAELVSTTGTEHMFRLTVPRRWRVRLFIDSELAVTDWLGRPMETRQRTSQEIPPLRSSELALELQVN
jgi:hypothetical protein